MAQCENCKSEHDGSYGSGRFCSVKCSRGFSTKAKRKKINKQVSTTLKNKIDSGVQVGWAKRKYFYEDRICPLCNISFNVSTVSERKYCRKCTFISPEYREHASEIKINSILSGKSTKFGKSKKCLFNFNKELIKCDSKLEYFGVKYIVDNFNPTQIQRCNFSIPYIDFLGHHRKFIPDFIIHTNNSILIMECKYDKLYYKLNEKWQHYIENSILKKEALEKYCKTNSYTMIWFTNKTGIEYKHR